MADLSSDDDDLLASSEDFAPTTTKPKPTKKRHVNNAFSMESLLAEDKASRRCT